MALLKRIFQLLFKNNDSKTLDNKLTSKESTNVSMKGKTVDNEALFDGEIEHIDTFIKYQTFLIDRSDRISERELREKNALKAFRFSVVWAIFTGFIILFNGFKIDIPYIGVFELTEKEFTIIVTTLTLSILGYYLLVLKYLFYRPEK